MNWSQHLTLERSFPFVSFSLALLLFFLSGDKTKTSYWVYFILLASKVVVVSYVSSFFHYYQLIVNTERELGKNENGRREGRSAETEENSGDCLRIRQRPKMGRLLVQHPHSSQHGFWLRCPRPLQAQVLSALHRTFSLSSGFSFFVGNLRF